MTWEQELEKMQSEKEFAKGEYLNVVSEQEQELAEKEKEKVRRKHENDLKYLRNHGMTMDELREKHKDDVNHKCHYKTDYEYKLREKENPIPDWTNIAHTHWAGR